MPMLSNAQFIVMLTVSNEVNNRGQDVYTIRSKMRLKDVDRRVLSVVLEIQNRCFLYVIKWIVHLIIKDSNYKLKVKCNKITHHNDWYIM